MIEITKWTAYRSGARIGFCDAAITSWRLEIRGLSVFEKAGARWCELPKKPYEVNGETKYQDILAWSDAEIRARFQRAVVDALEQAGHVPPVEATGDRPTPNKSNPDRVRYEGWNHRPADHPTPTADDIPY
jgi:hypothetical protein